MSDERCLTDMISDILSSREPRFFDDRGLGSYRHAGVLLPLLEEEGICKVLFTKRTERVEHHKGQISFPGGAVEEEDTSIEETALRETCEEIGVPEEDVEVLGRIDDTLTVASNYVVHPVVGLITRIDDLTINKAEVKKIIKAPLRLFHPAISGDKKLSVEYEGVIYETPAYEYGEHVIWGATARVMKNFMEIVGDKLCLPQAQK